MSSGALEQLRAVHEDVETYERTVVSVLDTKARTHRERIVQGHRVSAILEQIVNLSKKALEIYEDKDKSFEDELDNMRGAGIFTSFYDRLKEVREYHKKYKDICVVNEPDMEDIMNPSVQFSGEERYGKYVDLHQLYTRYINLPVLERKKSQSSGGGNIQHVEYLEYLGRIQNFADIPKEAKKKTEYTGYLQDLLAYLSDFYRRTQPLVALDDIIMETTNKFEKSWGLNQVDGWSSVSSKDHPFCEPCQKSFSTDGVFKQHLNGKKHKKALKQHGDSNTRVPSESDKETALLERKTAKICELLTEVIDATKAHVQLKQTRTPEELEADVLEEEEGALPDVDMGEEDDDDEVPFYNPLNLPLGWDGKPIPYWLYKLHGLGVEFKCEICGNHTYWGRRAYDRHFQEWRHAHGMRCLKIPNTKHFHDITLIEDAINLYEKIKDVLKVEVWKPDDEEEYEDSEGNVLNKKTYNDLARQGLL